jgi:NADH dehydrogenase
MKPLRVVCLGGGWVAIYLARALRKAIQRGQVDLTVVSRDNYSTVHGLIAEMLTCKVQPQQINASVRDLLGPARLHNAEIESVDLQNQCVLTRSSIDGRTHSLQYDHLVVGVGSIEDLSRYAGIAEHTFPLKTFANCFRLRNHLLSTLEMAAIETDPDERRRLLTFVVAGGNYAGVEVACDLVDYFRLLTRRMYPELKFEEFRVVLLEMGSQILPELAGRHPHLVRTAEKRVKRLGIDVRSNTGLAAATADGAALNTGDSVPTGTIITCTGMKPSPLLEQFPYARDKRGRLETDQFCRVPKAENIWAGGDCAAVPHPDGGTCPPLAHYAQKAGWNIGVNIGRLLQGRLLKPYSFNGLGEACTLGHGHAIAHFKGVPACGWLAWIGWRFIVLTMFVPCWKRRVRLMFDWLLTMLLGRDIVNPRIVEHAGISHALFEPGQLIVPEGDTRRYHYLIEAGEVEVLARDGNNQSVLSSLKVGDYFGHATRPGTDCSIRARTRVRLLAIDRDAADALSHVRPDLAMMLKEGGRAEPPAQAP